MLLNTESLLISPNTYRTAMPQLSFDKGMRFARTAPKLLKKNDVGLMEAASILTG